MRYHAPLVRKSLNAEVMLIPSGSEWLPVCAAPLCFQANKGKKAGFAGAFFTAWELLCMICTAVGLALSLVTCLRLCMIRLAIYYHVV